MPKFATRAARALCLGLLLCAARVPTTGAAETPEPVLPKSDSRPHHMVDLFAYASSAPTDWTYDNLKWFVAFCDREGQPKDFLFDAFTVCGYGCAGKRHLLGIPDRAGDWPPALKSDWDDALRNWMLGVVQLNDAFDRVRTILKHPDRKAKVSISIPYPDPRNVEFGPINGKMLNLSLHADRVALVKWHVDSALSQWDKLARDGKLDAVELVSFYWAKEGLWDRYPQGWPAPNPSDPALIKEASDYVHGKGYLLYWGPALGVEKMFDRYPLKSLGVDLSVLQINYQSEEKPGRELSLFDEQTAAARKCGATGLCICPVMSTNNPRTWSWHQVQLANLEAALRLHWETFSAHDYFQGAAMHLPGFARDPATYIYYEKWYKWVKGTLTEQDLEELARDVTAKLKAEGHLSEEQVKKIEAAPTVLEKLHLMEKPVAAAPAK